MEGGRWREGKEKESRIPPNVEKGVRAALFYLPLVRKRRRRRKKRRRRRRRRKRRRRRREETSRDALTSSHVARRSGSSI